MQFRTICVPLKPIITHGANTFNIIYLNSTLNINIVLYKDYQYEKQQQFEKYKKKQIEEHKKKQIQNNVNTNIIKFYYFKMKFYILKIVTRFSHYYSISENIYKGP